MTVDRAIDVPAQPPAHPRPATRLAGTASWDPSPSPGSSTARHLGVLTAVDVARSRARGGTIRVDAFDDRSPLGTLADRRFLERTRIGTRANGPSDDRRRERTGRPDRKRRPLPVPMRALWRTRAPGSGRHRALRRTPMARRLRCDVGSPPRRTP
jgi:hypothetical protein